MVDALNIKVGNPLRKLVLVKLADNANDDGECWPSYQKIADTCEISRRSAINHIKWLEEHGFLISCARKDADGMNRTNIYKLTIAEGKNADKNDGGNDGGQDSLHSEQDSSGGESIASGGESNDAKVVQQLHPEPVNKNLSKNQSRTHESRANARMREAQNFDPISALKAEGVSEGKIRDWLAIRETKGAKGLTARSYQAIMSEIEKAGLSAIEFVDLALFKGWRGFGADWNWQASFEEMKRQQRGDAQTQRSDLQSQCGDWQTQFPSIIELHKGGTPDELIPWIKR